MFDQQMQITSRDNEKLKFARRVRDGKEDNFMVVEGARLCGEYLRHDTEIEFGFVRDEFDLSAERTFPLFTVSEKLLESIADTKSPQGIILIAKRPKPISIEEILDHKDSCLPLIVFLYRINNPSNLGAVIRTAEAAGIAGIVVSENSADPFSPKSLRASMGSAFRLPISTNAAIDNSIDLAKKKNFQMVAVDIKGTVSHTEFDWKKKTLLVFGSEADGLSDAILSRADTKLRIQMNNEVESLNLAVSSGIVLFEARRQLNG